MSGNINSSEKLKLRDIIEDNNRNSRRGDILNLMKKELMKMKVGEN